MSSKKLLYPLLLLLAIAGMYYSAVWAPFISYDNNEFIIENPLLGSWNWNNFCTIWKIGGIKLENLYIPLTYVTYFLETGLFGKNPLLIHLDNILIHTANSLLLYFFAKRIGLKSISAFIASLAFALHPLQVEPVVWCMGRKDLLSTLFALLCMHCYFSYSRQRFIRWIFISLICGIFAMLAKPVMVILPGILLLIEFFLLDSYDGAGIDIKFSSFKKFTNSCITQWKFSKEKESPQNSFIIRKLTIILLSVYSLLTVFFNLSGPFRDASTKTPFENVLCVIYLLAGWIKRFFMFESLEHFYRWPADSVLYAKTGGGFLILFITGILIIYFTVISRYDKKIIFGMLFFIIGFLPPLAHLKYTHAFITADRYGYFPLIGIFIAIAAFYDNSSERRKKIFSALLSIWFIFIFINNFYAVKSWSNDIEFWKLEFKTKPENDASNYFLGLSYQKAGDYKNALEHYEKCIMNESEYTQKALISSGSIFYFVEQYIQAEKFYNEALKLESEHTPLIYTNLAEVYLKQKKIKPALEAFKKAVELDDSLGEIHVRIAQIYLYQKKKELALKHAEKAKRLGTEWSDDLKDGLKK